MLPARAGMIPTASYSALAEQSAPRASGDDPVAEQLRSAAAACSPRERG